MRVKAKWHHVIEVSREVEVDEADFREWALARYGEGYDTDLALACWIDDPDNEYLGSTFRDWRTSEALPSDFEFAYSDVIDAELVHSSICQPTKHEWAPHPTTPGLAVCVICGLLERTDTEHSSTDQAT